MNIKKFISIIVFCAIVFTLCSCTNSNNKNDNENLTNENFDDLLKITLSESELNNFSKKNFNMYLYSTAECNYILDGQRTTKFDRTQYIDEKAEPTKRLKINGTTYSITYKESAVFALSDLEVQTYTIDGLKNAHVFLHPVDGSVVRYANIPYTESLNSEEDYIEFMQKIFPSSNYSSYDYKCMTHCFTSTDTFSRSHVEDGFLLENENENRTIHSRYFFFTQSIGSVETQNHISANFDNRDHTFTIEMIDFHYMMDEVPLLLNLTDKLDDILQTYVKNSLRSEFTLSEYNIEKHKLFLKDEKPYILTTVSVNFTQNNDSSLSQYTTNIQIISGLKE